ncbi:MAG TPA: electron transfer flavoprotein subunit alpha/FixB family protein, partial [Gemmatimonadaceae bacterium]
MTNVFAFAETRNGELRKIGLEAVTAARALADTTGGHVDAFIAGAPGIAACASQLAKYGADTVLVAEHPAFEKYNPEAIAAIVADRIRTGGYRVVIFPTSALGSDLAPRVAAKLDVGLVTDVTEITLHGDAVIVKHPVNIGKVLATVMIATNPALVAIRANMFTPVEKPRAGTVERAEPIGDPAASRVVVKEVKLGGGTKLDLGEAPVIVSGGRGLRGPENFHL